uniref:Uncharacterized protein n=1 Tax=Arundo donax TaxID=35708 RepID=A0A0A9DEN9_ARUDO
MPRTPPSSFPESRRRRPLPSRVAGILSPSPPHTFPHGWRDPGWRESQIEAAHGGRAGGNLGRSPLWIRLERKQWRRREGPSSSSRASVARRLLSSSEALASHHLQRRWGSRRGGGP